jgi:hypothetical protein
MSEIDGRPWQIFIEGQVYAPADAPWCDDPAFAVITEHAGLRDSLGGDVARALTLALEMVRATADVDLLDIARARRPAQGLCLGFGMNALEPYDLLRVFGLDRVHAYEWIGEQVVEAARMLQELRADDPLLPGRIRLHQESLSNLSALPDASIRIVYTANVFNAEIPMTPETFHGAVREMLRVLSAGGVVISRGSIGSLETHLAPHGRMLLRTGLVSVFQKQEIAEHPNSHCR